MSLGDALSRCPLFEGFSETGLQIFAAIAQERRLAAGAPLFREGEQGASLFVVASGSLRIVQRAAAGEREVARVGEHEHVGALALLAPGPRLATAVAAADCELVELAAADFAALQPEKPKACLKLALAIAADVQRRAWDSRDVLRQALARAEGSG